MRLARARPHRRSIAAVLMATAALAAASASVPAAARTTAPAPARAPAPAAPRDPFVDDEDGVIVDWRRGTISATVGQAADLRMPSAEVARPRAERRAQAVARARLAKALRGLTLGRDRRLDEPAVNRALALARSTTLERESNGGAIVRLEVWFGDWVSAPAAQADRPAPADESSPPPLALWLPEGRLVAAPVVVVAGLEISLDRATYASAAGLPSGARPLPVQADTRGRLLVKGAVSPGDLEGRRATIYIQKILR